MILGKIFGKITTNHFKFMVEHETTKFEYLQVYHKVYDYVLCQVTEIIRENDSIIAECSIIGYKDENGKIKSIRIPFEPGTEVLRAEDEFIKEIIQLSESSKGAFIGKLEGRDIEVSMDLNKLLTKHVAILAKSGAGKSYTVGVLLEEIMNQKIPLLIIDPHGEYGDLKHPNLDEEEKLEYYNLKPKGFSNIKEYGDTKINMELRPLRLNNNLNADEVVHLMPSKPSGSQIGMLYSAIKNLDTINFTNILLELQHEENNAKWTLINSLDYLNNLDLFSSNHVSFNELVQSNSCSVINLKGVPPDVQEIIVYKLLKDLFENRKQNRIPPFFTVIEEAHNYCPERSFGETKCSKIIRTIASEGRKFGMGLCVVSQRPARVDKSVLSQCSTQMILKVTNPNDLKSITNSVEGITSESEEEIRNLSIGTSMVAGVTDTPLFVNIRPRMTKHGGDAVDMIDEQVNFDEEMTDFQSQELLPVIKPKTTIKDLKVMSEKPIKEVHQTLIPGYLFLCKENTEFSLLVEMINGEVVSNLDDFKTKKIPDFSKLDKKEVSILRFAFKTPLFSIEDLVSKGAPLDIDQILDKLVIDGLLVKKDKDYCLNSDFIFGNLAKNACYEMINYIKVDYHDKLEAKQDIDRIKEKIGKITTVLDIQNCFIVKYEIIYDDT